MENVETNIMNLPKFFATIDTWQHGTLAAFKLVMLFHAGFLYRLATSVAVKEYHYECRSKNGS